MPRRGSFLATVVALAMTAGACLPLAQAPTTTAPASVAPSPSTLPAVSPSTVSPSATLLPSPGIHVTPVAALPADPHFFAVGQGDSTRILLFDSSSTRPPVEVVRFDVQPTPPNPDVREIAFGASADGRVLVIARRFSEQRTVHYLVRPQTGELVVLLTDLARSFIAPVVSPDGTRYAYARLADAAGTGVFIADARAGPAPKRMVAADPQIVGSPPHPVAWSPDGAWLAVTLSDTGGSRMFVVEMQAGETALDVGTGEFTGGNGRRLGPGHAIDWRGGAQNLLIASSRHAFGGRSFVYATAVTGGPPRELYVPADDTVVADAEWDPAVERFFVHQRALCCGVGLPITIRVQRPGAPGMNVFEDPFVGVPWWSNDGTRLWARIGGDDSIAYLRDLLSATSVMFCLRSASPPCA